MTTPTPETLNPGRCPVCRVKPGHHPTCNRTTPETPAGGLTTVKTLIRDLGDMACIGCRANTCPACALAAEITSEVHVIVQARAEDRTRLEAAVQRILNTVDPLGAGADVRMECVNIVRATLTATEDGAR